MWQHNSWPITTGASRIVRGFAVVVVAVLVSVLGSPHAQARHVTASGAPCRKMVRHTCPITISARPVRLTIRIHRLWAKSPKEQPHIVEYHGVTRNPTLIARVAEVLDQVDAVTPNSVHSCPAFILTGVLRFSYRHRQPFTVRDRGCFGFSSHGRYGTALGDPFVYTSIYRLEDRIAHAKPWPPGTGTYPGS